jgi:microcystin-dependent protein
MSQSFKSLTDLVAGHGVLSPSPGGAALNLAETVHLSAPTLSNSTETVRATTSTYRVADDAELEPAPAAAVSDALTATSDYSPYLAIRFYIPQSGIFPPRPANYDDAPNESAYFGGLRMFAGNFTPQGSIGANGQILSISQNTALFSIYGTTYGGDGKSTFALPDLDGRSAVGFGQGPGLSLRDLGEQFGSGSINIVQSNLPATSGGSHQPLDTTHPSLALTYMIQVEGIFPSQNSLTGNNMSMLGLITQFGGNFAPTGYLPCDGRLLSIADYTTLFYLLGTTYGGDGEETFALPDLRGRQVVGVETGGFLGETFGTEQVTLLQNQVPSNMGGGGQPIANEQPSLAMYYIISLQGIFPSQNANVAGAPNDADPDTPYLGEIAITAINYVPKGSFWARPMAATAPPTSPCPTSAAVPPSASTISTSRKARPAAAKP